MNRVGVLLDTGPIVALLSENDDKHDEARQLFAACTPPLRTCEAVVAEACFLMRRVDRDGPAEVIGLARKGLFDIGLRSIFYADWSANTSRFEFCFSSKIVCYLGANSICCLDANSITAPI